jgi:hypothetical protein
MSKYIIIFIFQIIISLNAVEYNPWDLGLFTRIISRKNVGHLVIETRPDHYRVTFLVSDRFPYNYKSAQYPFFIRYRSEVEALEIAKKFDKHLDSGYEIKLNLNGSQIVHYELLNK